MTRVLIVDDDPVHLRLTVEVARRAGFRALTATGGAAALDMLRADPTIGAVILDLVMPETDGMAVMAAMAREGIAVPVIVQTASASLETVTTAMRHGAVDFFVKPVAPERLVISLRNAIKLDALESALRAERGRRAGTLSARDMIASAPAMARVLLLTRKAARSTIPLLIEGEAGTGKQLLARIVQGGSDRAGKPFVTIDCAALPQGEAESLLFGDAGRRGAFAEAHGGIVLLEEIGALSEQAQTGLLRVLEKGEIVPAGAAGPERVDVRLIATTSRRLLNLARSGAFREDLYYRLNVMPVYLPPLRERVEDIPALAEHFLARCAAEAGRRVVGVSAPALELLARYDWPGNVRQLENAVYRAVVLSEGGFLETADFPQIVARIEGREGAIAGARPVPAAPVHIDAAAPLVPEPAPSPPPDRFVGPEGEIAPLSAVERELIGFAIAHYGGRMSRVARALGIGRSTLYRKLHEYGLTEGTESDAA